MSTRLVPAILCAAALALAGGAEAAQKKPAAPKPPPCVSGADESAMQLRTVQTELMVAALSCNAADRYNAFVTGNRPVLMEAYTQLKRYFRKRGGEKALNAFITGLANDTSTRSVKHIAKFCQDTGYLYDALAAPTRGDLKAFVAQLYVAQLHRQTSCNPPVAYLVPGPGGVVTKVAAAGAPPVAVADAAPPAAAQPAAPPPAAAPSAPPPAAAQPVLEDVPVPLPKPFRTAQR